ncbi:DNA polymerase delta small subunit, putative [Theileria equi strain WA]|uniref:DNA polymerase delta small subunit, putative n=1 Tax=Theileria equi strain WA TaxID=1537102 RepID=L0AWT4_THEEQ|nr:DNA polymerase delta small subunit, putative [Theileria equi strain WA]AFZ79359.1 DNA polymerase delta small subunit, putative [Theileria equi strain WA]|eukprot:XP_004829025.1 DNA polymerase delta small subunit, putative [Theileria equi strain WA]
MEVERLSGVYSDELSKRFKKNGVPYTSQYHFRTVSRLNELKPIILKTVIRCWPDIKDESPIRDEYRIAHSVKDAKGRCIVIGTVYKEMKRHPSPLNAYKHDFAFKKEEITEFTNDDDYLTLEDQTQRLIITGDFMDPHRFTSGMVLAMKGYITPEGLFNAEDYTFAGPPPLLQVPVKTEDKFIAIISGLEVAGPNVDHDGLLLLQEFLLGNLSDTNHKIIRLVVAGNGVGSCDLEAISDSDTFFAQLASSIPVDLMPGAKDPTNANLPQQMISPSFMDHSKRYGTFKSTTNPYLFTVDDVRFLGISGQSVQDICNYSRLSELDALKIIADSRCIAPTGIDSLPCHSEMDVFNLADDDEYPHVFFSGNAKEFAAGTIGENKLPKVICVPSFNDSPTLVLVSLSSLDVTTVKLSSE